MNGYTKIFASMLTSSVWQESHTTLRVWWTFLLTKGPGGIVDASIPGLASLAHVTIPECEAAIAILSGPDQYSRTPDHEGRRIVPHEGGGWRVVNHEKYKELLGPRDDRREQKSAYERARRARKRAAAQSATRTAVDTIRAKKAPQ